ncbi:MAG: nucleotide exchange factor GrpE [Phycisphaeraceae bacterium]
MTDNTPPTDEHNNPDTEQHDDTGLELTPEEPLSELEQLRIERDEFESKFLRAAADYQNYARRAGLNADAAREQAVFDTAKKLVSVMDAFDRALAIDPEKTTITDLLAGVSLVREEFLKTLNSLGVERIEAQPGEPFDPARHEALMRANSDDYEPNHVVQQFQPGYAARGKTVRGAQVSVSA